MTAPERLSDERLRELRETAEKATPGPWRAHRDAGDDLHFGRMDFTTVDTAEGNLFAVAGMALADADHIANCDPPTVQALLTEVTAARAMRAAVEALADEWAEEHRVFPLMHIHFKKAADTLRALLAEHPE